MFFPVNRENTGKKARFLGVSGLPLSNILVFTVV
jgi:hypothetical protein